MGDVRESGESVAEGPEIERITEPGTSQEDARETDISQEGAREQSISHEGVRELSGSQGDAREPGASQEGTRDPSASQEGTRDPSASQEGTRDPSASQEGTRDPSASQESTRDPSASQEGTRDPSASQEGTRDPSASQEGTRDPSASQEGTRDPSASQEGTREFEALMDQETVGDPSAGRIDDIDPTNAMEEDGKVTITETGSSLHLEEELGGSSNNPTDPHHETEEYAVIPKDDELETTKEMDLESKEETQLLGEQEEGQEEDKQNQELQEEVDNNEQIREELLQQYHTLAQERDKIQQHNSQLQHKLYEYFRKKKGDETRPETSKHAADQEQRYLKYLTTLEEMRRKYKEEASLHQQQVEEIRAQCQDIVSKVDKEWVDFQEQKKKIALCSLSKRGAGKNMASTLIQEIDLLQSREERKEKEVIQVRLEDIKLKNQIQRHESTLRSKEELAEGLHLIDFEQLKIENQTYNEKIEERNEELLKLRKKITNTVQVLTHVKEKLQFVQAENHEQKEKLFEVEALVANKRDILTRTKQARDSLRMDNLKLKQKCGLLGNKVLLRDFEDKVDATEELKQTLENLKRRHAELTLSSKGLLMKINEAKVIVDG